MHFNTTNSFHILGRHNLFKISVSGAWYKHDNEDRPLFILRLGVMDVKGIIKSVSSTSYYFMIH